MKYEIVKRSAELHSIPTATAYLTREAKKPPTVRETTPLIEPYTPLYSPDTAAVPISSPRNNHQAAVCGCGNRRIEHTCTPVMTLITSVPEKCRREHYERVSEPQPQPPKTKKRNLNRIAINTLLPLWFCAWMVDHYWRLNNNAINLVSHCLGILALAAVTYAAGMIVGYCAGTKDDG